MDRTEFAVLIYERLRELYGVPNRNPPPLNNQSDPLDELVYILITLLTHEKNVNRAYSNLRARFSTWKEAASAPTEDIVQALQIAGLANQKAPRLKEMLQRIQQYDPNVTLEFLKNWPDEEIEEFLTSLKGVGKKAARCVMMYSLGRNVLPVDTHVYRVSRRLGLISAETTYDKAMEEIHQYVPAELRYDLHVNMVIHGRQICIAPIPKCAECGLKDFCASYIDGVFVPPTAPPGNARPRH